MSIPVPRRRVVRIVNTYFMYVDHRAARIEGKALIHKGGKPRT